MPNEKWLIDANEAYENARLRWDFHRSIADLISLEEVIEDCPTVDSAEVIHGRWENITGGMITLGDCSECKVRQPVIGTNYCKNCGAKMDGDGNG